MNEHYYTARPEAAHRRQEVELRHGAVHLVLTTDASVFSRGGVDPGTKLLIASVPPPLGGLVLDLGCGYGPIGLYYAACAPACFVHMTDVNERAVALAAENAARNGLTNVAVHAGAGFAAVPPLQFDLIATNPPIRAGRAVLLELFAGAHARLRPGGRLAFVARTRQGAKTLAKAVEQLFGNVTDVARGGGYRVYISVLE
jgi:16S rRNA (guanine1207-N2)-methyltransferase